MRNLRWLVPVLLFTVITVFLFRGLSLHPSDLPSVLIGKPAPAFSAAQPFPGSPMFSRDRSQGNVTLLTFWASWCAGCEQEQPFLMSKRDDPRVVWWGVNYKDTTDAAHAFLARVGNPFSAMAADPTGRLGMDFGVYGTPETFLLDGAGIIRYRHAGPMTDVVWQTEVEPLIMQYADKEDAA